MDIAGSNLKSGPEISALTVVGFPQDEDQQKIEVLRYVPLARFLSLLELEAMWFSRLGALQDRFECTDPRGVRARLMALAKNPDTQGQPLPFGSWEQLLTLTEQGCCGDDGRKMGAVNCWFLGNSESEKMWKKYGDEGKGIAIRSTVMRLATAFQITGLYAQVSRVGRVEYVDFESHDMGSRGNDLAFAPFIKDNAFSAENEVRIVTLNSFHSGCLYPDGSQAGCPGSQIFCPDIKGFYIKCDLKRLIRSIIVGPNTETNFRELVKRLVGRYRLMVDVEHSKLPAFT